MIERINDFAARHFGGVGTTRASLVRIHVWIIACLVAISALAPTHAVPAAARRSFGPVQTLARSYDDQRAFLPSPYGKRHFHGDFHIAWIMGSEGDQYGRYGRYLLPHHLATPVQHALPVIDGRPVVVDIYYLPAARLGDEYFSLLDALQTKPDLVVMSLNPVWVLNPYATHQWTQLDARAALALASKPEAWPIAAALLSPSDLLWGVAQSRLKAIAERAYWSTRIHDLVDDLGPLNRSKLAKAAADRKPDLSDRVLTDQAVEMWFNERLHFQAGTDHLYDRNTMTSARWAEWIDSQNEVGHPLNTMLLRAIGAALKSSRIPSYVYLAQVNTDWLQTDPTMGRAVAGVEHQLEDMRGAFSARNIRYQPKTASRFLFGLQFLGADPVHMTAAPGFGPYLASQLCQLETNVGKGAGCMPVEGSANG